MCRPAAHIAALRDCLDQLAPDLWNCISYHKTVLAQASLSYAADSLPPLEIVVLMGEAPKLSVSQAGARRFAVKVVFSWVASRANVLYLAYARTHNPAAVCLHAANNTALREFLLPADTPLLLPQHGLGA